MDMDDADSQLTMSQSMHVINLPNSQSDRFSEWGTSQMRSNLAAVDAMAVPIDSTVEVQPSASARSQFSREFDNPTPVLDENMGDDADVEDDDDDEDDEDDVEDGNELEEKTNNTGEGGGGGSGGEGGTGGNEGGEGAGGGGRGEGRSGESGREGGGGEGPGGGGREGTSGEGGKERKVGGTSSEFETEESGDDQTHNNARSESESDSDSQKGYKKHYETPQVIRKEIKDCCYCCCCPRRNKFRRGL